MHGYLALFFVVAVAYVRADVGGYNYNGGPFGGVIPQAPIINKHFYLHAAPEERSDEIKHFTIGRPQKNYRVIFVKTPSAPAPRIIAELAPQEEKTAVYVLSQKEHEIDPNDIVTPAPALPSKPEVFFIRYRTPEEAENAQRQIQAQYDALGGSSQVTDEGLSPVSSVVGLGGRGGGGGGSGFGGLGAGSAPQGSLGGPGLNNGYLPPSLFARRFKKK